MSRVANYRITVQESGKSFFCTESQFVLDAMRHSGCGPIHHGCCGGGCGVCKMKVAGGRFEMGKRMSRAHISEQEEASGVVLLCCIQPRSDLVLQSV